MTFFKIWFITDMGAFSNKWFQAHYPKKRIVFPTKNPTISIGWISLMGVSPANLVWLDWPTSEEVEGALWNLKTPRSRRNPKKKPDKCNSSNLKSSCNLRKLESNHIIKHFYSACKPNMKNMKKRHFLHVNTVRYFELCWNCIPNYLFLKAHLCTSLWNSMKSWWFQPIHLKTTLLLKLHHHETPRIEVKIPKISEAMPPPKATVDGWNPAPVDR